MPSLYWLNQIQHTSRLWVGNQALYLSHLQRRGYPVLPSFIVPAASFQEFIESIHWVEPFADIPTSSLHLNVDNPQQLQAIAQHLRQEITRTELPELWLEHLSEAIAELQAPTLMLQPSLALKPPADNLLALEAAEIFESSICLAKPEAVATALKKVWAELFRAKSLLYWQRAEIPLEQICLAVLVYPVLPAIAAGTVQVKEHNFLIQSTWGLETAIAWGEVTPDSYEVEASQGILQTKVLGSKTCAHTPPHPPDFLPFLGNLSQTSFQHPDSCLQVHLLAEAQQNQYALPAQALSDLIQIAQQLQADFGTACTCKWMLVPGAAETQPKLYLTQLNLDTPDPSSLDFPPVDSTAKETAQGAPIAHALLRDPPLLLKGLAAANGQAIADAIVITEPVLPEHLPSGRILVAAYVTPDWLPWLQQAAGLIIEQGGMTSHAAILARELGLPAIVGASQATQMIRSGDRLLLDSSRGEVYQIDAVSPYSATAPATAPATGTTTPADRTAILYPEKRSMDHVAPDRLPASAPTQVRDRTWPAIATQLLVNLSQLQSLKQVQHFPIDGVGLLRSELMLLDLLEQQHPRRWLQPEKQPEFITRMARRISQFAQAFAPRPVFYRSLDLRSHEFRALEGGQLSPPEANPILGLHGSFSYLVDSALFDLELMALAEVQQMGYSNVHLILPFVRTVEEFYFCQQRVEQAGLTQQAEFQLWIMAEVPSILFLLPDYVKAGVQGISIGTNDLTQLLLGVDRDQPEMAAVFSAMHPAVTQAIAQLIRMAQQAGIPCSICGQAPAQYPELIDRLVQWGITSISIDVEAVERTYHAIARSEQRLLLEAARRQLGFTT